MTRHHDPLRDEELWETLAQQRPYWASCTSGKRHVNWQLDEFMATGEHEVSWAMQVANDDSIYPVRQSLAVDFGCGPGRLIGPLKKSFDQVVGVDISPTMLSLARRIHPEGNVSFSKSTAMLEKGTVDLIYSTFVLQHIEQGQIEDYFREFSRILHPHGLLIFQYPARPRRTLAGLAYLLLPLSLINFLKRYVLRYPGMMPMSWMYSARMIEHATSSGLSIVDYRAGPRSTPNWEDIWYFARKTEGVVPRSGEHHSRA